jgi:sialate O-acetylesterase
MRKIPSKSRHRLIQWTRRIGSWLWLAATSPAWGAIELPPIFTDGAVLQREEPVPVWGRAPAGSQLTLRFAGETRQVQADDAGNWRAEFAPRKAGGPHEIQLSSGDFSKTIRDVWMGDVWVCSGQSNMEWPLRNSADADAQIQAAPLPQIRHFKVPRGWAAQPAAALAGGEWLAATPEHLGDFTGVGWFFAREVNRATGVPIGLINASWGGSRIEAWMSPQALGKSPEATRKSVEQMAAEGEARARAVAQSLRRWPGAVVPKVTLATADWSAPELDERDWLEIQAPSLWEEQGFPGVDGVIWYRRSFELSASQAAAGITLGLGRIDDNDITWVNGHRVGETNAYDRVRRYEVPAEYLREGRNQIAVRVEDNGGGGGIYSNANLLYWQSADGQLGSLSGPWKIKADRVSITIIDNVHHLDTALYNQMIHPLFPLPVKGVLWYQGESNAVSAQQAEEYRKLFPAMINDWRARWNKPELPFYWVQLANFISNSDTPETSPWAILRESQTAALALKNTGQAVIIDVGNPADIHPTDKKTVGERLARIALHQTYGKKDIHFRGPVFQSAEVAKDQLIVKFSTSGKLAPATQGFIKGFEVAGKDGKFRKLEGIIQANNVVLPLSGISQPQQLRYAWSDNPEVANLMDVQGLPAEPFRIHF